MSKRYIEFYEDEYYHVFNRGVDKRIIFKDKGDLFYFFDSLVIANRVSTTSGRGGGNSQAREKQKSKSKKEEKLVLIIAYCLLPNHFHLILKEIKDGGISKFMQKLGTSYAMFFNKKYKRTGSLFEGKFKSTHLNKEGSLELTSAYVNLNYKHHKIDLKKELVKSSVFEYLNTEKGEKICDALEISDIIENDVKGYKEYLKRQGEYFFERKGHNINNIDFKELEK